MTGRAPGPVHTTVPSSTIPRGPMLFQGGRVLALLGEGVALLAQGLDAAIDLVSKLRHAFPLRQ